MAETAALNSAHSHVRRATEEAQQVHWSGAADEYERASLDFARASKTSSDAEALRVLKLLEDQHRKLARIVRTRDSVVQDQQSDGPKPTVITSSKDAPTSNSPVIKPTEASSKPETSSLKVARASGKARDSSPSLARDIASRRGIPPPKRSLTTSTTQATPMQASSESRRNSASGAAGRVSPSVVDDQKSSDRVFKARQSQDDEGFSKFYNNLTNGTVSKLSSMLAFAGLPLNTEDSQPEPPPEAQSTKRSVTAPNDPDVTKLFSKAALEALEDSHRQRGTSGHGFGPAESFYVVQKGGGTYSYADIARAHQHTQTQLPQIDEANDFLDAKETAPTSNPTSPKPLPTPQQRPSFSTTATPEELALENATLKQTLSHLASRLETFEAHAQDASMAALTQSMMHPPKPPTATVDAERVRVLEAEVERQAREKGELEGQVARQERLLRRYQGKWEEVKKGARERERVRREGKGGEGGERVSGGGREG